MNHAACVTYALATFISAPTIADSVVKPTKNDPVFLGRGYDTRTARFSGQCITQEPKRRTGAGGNGCTTVLEIKKIDSFQQLRENIDAGASGGARWGFTRVSASMNYLKDHAFNSYDLQVAIMVRVENTAEALVDPAMTKDAFELWNTNRVQFYETCGNEFLSTITTGGELVGTLAIHTQSESDRTQTSVAISGSYFGAEGAARFSRTLEGVQKNHSIQYRLVRAGATGNVPIATPASLLAYAENFPSLVCGNNAQNSVVFSGLTQSYKSIPALMKTTIKDDTKATVAQLEQWADIIESAFITRNDLQYALENPWEFHSLDVHTVKSRIKEFDTLITNLSKHAKDCATAAPLQETGKASECPEFTAKMPAPLALERYDLVHIVSHDMKYKVSEPMPAGYTCIALPAHGKWSAWDNGDTWSDCGELSIQMNNKGTFARASFDSTYSDNRGTCLLKFACSFE